MAFTSLRFWSTVRPSHISTMTNGISHLLRLIRCPHGHWRRESCDEIFGSAVFSCNQPKRPACVIDQGLFLHGDPVGGGANIPVKMTSSALIANEVQTGL